SEIYLLQGRTRDALSEIARIRYEPLRVFMYAMAYSSLGRKSESDAALSEFMSKYPGWAYQIATIYPFRNQREEAFAWLDRAFIQRSAGLIGLKVDPLLKNLHGDPRYAGLLAKLKFPA